MVGSNTGLVCGDPHRAEFAQGRMPHEAVQANPPHRAKTYTLTASPVLLATSMTLNQLQSIAVQRCRWQAKVKVMMTGSALRREIKGCPQCHNSCYSNEFKLLSHNHPPLPTRTFMQYCHKDLYSYTYISD